MHIVMGSALWNGATNYEKESLELLNLALIDATTKSVVMCVLAAIIQT